MIGIGLFFAYPYLAEYSNYEKTLLTLISVPLSILVVTSCFSSSGKAFGIILLGFLLYPLTVDRNYLDIISHIVIDNTAMLGMSMSVMCGIVFLFVLAGQILVHLGVVDKIIEYITKHVNSPGRVAILSSAVFGSISGSAVANVMSTGQVTIPLMIKCGYSKTRAAAYEAVASTGGQLMPPVMGAAAFLMAEIIMVSYWDVALAAAIPALLFYSVLFISVPNKQINKKIIDFGIPKTPKKAKSDLTFRITEAMYGLVILSAAIGLIIGVMDQTGLSFHITSILNVASGGKTIILLIMVAILCIILGMGMPTSSTYLLVAIVAAPTLVDAGITEIWAHMFVLYFGVLSMITPPVALSAFAAAEISGSNPILTALYSMRLAWPLYFMPFIFVWF